MSFFRKRSKKEKPSAETPSKVEEKSFKQMSKLLVPILLPGNGPQKTIVINGEQHDLPKGSLPVTVKFDFDDLQLVFGIDMGVSFEWLQNKHIKDWSDEEQSKIANSAFNNWVKGSDLAINMISEDIGMIVGGQGLEASVFLVSSVWNAIYDQLGTKDVVFAMPARDVFVFARADKDEAVNTLRENAETLYSSQEIQKPISPKLYSQVGNDIEIYSR